MKEKSAQGTGANRETFPCPFCAASLEPFGPAQHNHPRNDCWLSSVKLDADEYRQWQARAAHGYLPATADVERDAARDVLAERRRQVDVEGWAPRTDDGYAFGELAQAAICYIRGSSVSGGPDRPTNVWPWTLNWWKPSTNRRNLVKAGALILAEIERLDRAAGQQPVTPHIAATPGMKEAES